MLIQNKCLASDNYIYDPPTVWHEFPIRKVGDSFTPYGGNEWLVKFANRDLTGSGSDVNDAFFLHCGETDHGRDLWYLNVLDAYIYSSMENVEILDMAYEQYGDSLYVLFGDDHCLYRFDHAADMADAQRRIGLVKDNATMRLETFHSTYITSGRTRNFTHVFIDYGSSTDSGAMSWNLILYGNSPDTCMETWSNSPGQREEDFKPFNVVMFGDSLFSAD